MKFFLGVIWGIVGTFFAVAAIGALLREEWNLLLWMLIAMIYFVWMLHSGDRAEELEKTVKRYRGVLELHEILQSRNEEYCSMINADRKHLRQELGKRDARIGLLNQENKRIIAYFQARSAANKAPKASKRPVAKK